MTRTASSAGGSAEQVDETSGRRVADAGRRVFRFTLSVAVAAAMSELIWQAVPNKLSVRTNVIGNPIFVGFDYRRLQYAFYLIALVFPTISIGTYYLAA